MHKLRMTWKNHFSDQKLLDIDREIKKLDPKWPIIENVLKKNLQVNIKFIMCCYTLKILKLCSTFKF